MARTVNEIQDEIIAAKEAEAELQGLTSQSSSAIWRLWTYIIALAINAHEQIWDQLAIEVEEALESQIAGTASWYTERLLEWQEGDEVILNEVGQIVYDPVDPTKNTITRASYKEDLTTGLVTFKVAQGETGSLAPLSAAQIVQVEGYLDKIKFAGTRTNVISLTADELAVAGTVFYDAQVSSEEMLDRIVASLNTYTENIPFDGQVLYQDIIDAIQATQGVTDVSTTLAVSIWEAGTTENVVEQKEELPSGYLIERQGAGNTWKETISLQLG